MLISVLFFALVWVCVICFCCSENVYRNAHIMVCIPLVWTALLEPNMWFLSWSALWWLWSASCMCTQMLAFPSLWVDMIRLQQKWLRTTSLSLRMTDWIYGRRLLCINSSTHQVYLQGCFQVKSSVAPWCQQTKDVDVWTVGLCCWWCGKPFGYAVPECWWKMQHHQIHQV